MDFPIHILIRRMGAALAGLIALTVSLLVWQRVGMERVLDLSAAGAPLAEALDDRSEQGGASVARLTRQRDALVLDCDLRAGFAWPYCQIVFRLRRDGSGVDLSGFDTISIDLAYEGASRHSVRLSLANLEPGQDPASDYAAQKVLETGFDLPRPALVRFPVKVLRTAPWWITKYNVPLLATEPRIDRVTALNLAIGEPDRLGRHRLVLRSLQFHGKLISQNQLLQLLIALWIGSALAGLGYALIYYRTQLFTSTSRIVMLSQINSALEQEACSLASRAHTDPLTGALNREGLRATLQEWRHGTPPLERMAVVFVDLDHFKSVNDTHGHDMGDDVLRTFAGAVQSAIRASDKLVRWGGEEFLVVCQSSSALEARGLAEKLRRSLHSQDWPGGLHLTASFGVADLQPGEDFEHMVKRADAALYSAKANGRDRVEAA